MRKKYKYLIILGILLVLTGIGLIMRNREDSQKKGRDTAQYAATTQTSQKEPDTQAENPQEDTGKQGTEQSEKQDDSNSIDKRDEINKVPKDAISNSHEILYYFYDENKNEKTDDFLENTYIVHVAPHWWWQEPVAPH